jgi:hypothetical protein
MAGAVAERRETRSIGDDAPSKALARLTEDRVVMAVATGFF